jgi:hypothetical protein
VKLTTSSILLAAAPLAALVLCASFSQSATAKVAPAPRLLQSVHVDIKPGSCPNPLNVDQLSLDELVCIDGVMLGVVPVSILGNKFDVDQVDIGTVGISRGGNFKDVIVRPIQIDYADTGTPFIGEGCECHALTGDGLLDLDLKFDKAELITAFGLDEEEDGTFVQLQVFGLAKGEIEFAGTDCIRVINH